MESPLFMFPEKGCVKAVHKPQVGCLKKFPVIQKFYRGITLQIFENFFKDIGHSVSNLTENSCQLDMKLVSP